MPLFESKEERWARVDQEKHDEGQKAGANASFVGEILHELGGSAFHSEKWNEGFENGKDNKPK